MPARMDLVLVTKAANVEWIREQRVNVAAAESAATARAVGDMAT